MNEHSKGSIEIPTELEVIMMEDAEFLIKDKYDNKEGAKAMQRLLNKSKESKSTDFLKLAKEDYDFDRKIKLTHMTRTW